MYNVLIVCIVKRKKRFPHTPSKRKEIDKEGLYLPCTPNGIIELLHRTGVSIEGSEAVIVGRSNIVGKPVALLLMAENATVTICHSRTKNLGEVTKRADARGERLLFIMKAIEMSTPVVLARSRLAQPAPA